jgi:hypothetical protein
LPILIIEVLNLRRPVQNLLDIFGEIFISVLPDVNKLGVRTERAILRWLEYLIIKSKKSLYLLEFSL